MQSNNYTESPFPIPLVETNAVISNPVLTVADVTLDSHFYLQIYKSSEFAEITTTKDYFCIFSSAHNNSLGGVWWAECDDAKLTGFVERGLIIDGDQSESPFLIKIPTSESGLTTDTLFLYYHTDTTETGNDGKQQTRLITCDGGLLHTATWTDRGRPLGIVGTDNHTGYLKIIKRGVSDYVGFHLTEGGGSPESYISTSTNGLSFTRTKHLINGYEYDGMGSLTQRLVFEGESYVICPLNNWEQVGIFKHDYYFRPITLVTYTPFIADIYDITYYVENNILTMLYKSNQSGGGSGEYEPYNYKEFDLL